MAGIRSWYSRLFGGSGGSEWLTLFPSSVPIHSSAEISQPAPSGRHNSVDIDGRRSRAVSTQDFADGNNAFAFALFQRVRAKRAFVKVDERGTEAAAATGVVMRRLAASRRQPPPPPVFRADHPFLFAIRDRKSGALLFLGRMVDPS